MQAACAHAVHHTAPEPPQTWQAFHSTARIHSCCRGSTIASDRCAKSSGPSFAHGPHRHFSAGGFGILASAAARGHTARTWHVHGHVRESARIHARRATTLRHYPRTWPCVAHTRAIRSRRTGACQSPHPLVWMQCCAVYSLHPLAGGQGCPTKRSRPAAGRDSSAQHGARNTQASARMRARTQHRTPVVSRQRCAHPPDLHVLLLHAERHGCQCTAIDSDREMTRDVCREMTGDADSVPC